MKNAYYYSLVLACIVIVLMSSTGAFADSQQDRVIQGMNNLQLQQKELSDNISARMEGVENVVVKTVRKALDDSSEGKEMAQQALDKSSAAQETAIQTKNDITAEVAALHAQIVELSQTVDTLKENQTVLPTTQTTPKTQPKQETDSVEKLPVRVADKQAMYGQMIEKLAQSFSLLEENGDASSLSKSNSEKKPYSAVESIMRTVESIIASNRAADQLSADKVVDNARSFNPVTLLAETNVFNFKPGGWELNDQSKAMIDQMLEKISGSDYQLITIVGHSDPTPHSKYNNFDLAQKRAESAKQYLIKKGIPSDKILFFSFGDAVSFASNANEEGRIQNRRVSVRSWAKGR